jgi:hypothetical protein
MLYALFIIASSDLPRRSLLAKAGAPLSINPEPLGCTRGLEFIERHTPGSRPESRMGRVEWVDFLVESGYNSY